MFASWKYSGGALIVLSFFSVARAEGEGQPDLDRATDIKLTARTVADLGRVIELCESAIDKGLDEDNESFARQLLTATLLERVDEYCGAIFGQEQLDPRWRQYRRLALKDIEKALTYDEKLGRAYYIMARLKTPPLGSRDEALQAADKAVEFSANDNRQRAEALVLRARLSTDAERRTADLDAAVEADAENIEARRVRGIHYLTRKKYDEAIDDLLQVIEKHPEDVVALQAVAEAFTSLKDYDEAAARLTRIIKLRPESPGGYLLRARLNQLRDDTDATLADLDKVLDLDTGNVFARMMRARIYLGQNKTEQAKEDVDRALERNPRLVEAILLRSMIFAREKNFAAAITDLKRIARALPDNVRIRLQLAALYVADERPRKAIEIYDEIVAADNQNSAALRGRGDARLAIGKHAEAIADYEAALKIDAEDLTLLNNFAWVLATSPVDELRDAKRAIELAEKACERTEYKTSHILSTLAAAYAESGDFKTARKWSAKALELGEGDIKEQLQEELESYKAAKPYRELKQVEERPEPEPPREEDLFID
jgi:tetratricopeptide (TPR) repeat protein